MEIRYDYDVDMMYIQLSDKPFHTNKVMGNGLVVLDLAEDGSLIGLELISPSLYVDKPGEIDFKLDGERKAVKPASSE